MPVNTEKQPQNILLEKKQKNLKYYQNKAIDFSKRNRLLKYPKKVSSIDFEISIEECPQFFGLMNELKIELPHKEILKQDVENENSQQSLINLEEEVDDVENLLPKTNVIGKKLITQLDKLRLQAKNNFDSHGLHTLFIAVGEIKWKETLAGRGSSEATSEYDYCAPLLLIPVEIKNLKLPQKKSIIELNDELYDIQVNPVLNLFIAQELELRIPEVLKDFSSFTWNEVEFLLNEFKKIFQEKQIECTTSTKIRLGQYAFHGQQIYEDLTRNEKEILDNEFVSSLCGDSQIIQSDESIQSDDEEDIDNFLTEEEDFTILDADESQLKSIKSVIKGKQMVIHGPPGTGKSQTIANLIANLLARGKKVLFVCEKRVALEVVFNRLKTSGADVSDLCLPLFQYTTDKKFFAKSIIDSRNRIISAMRKSSNNSINQKLADRKEKIDLLKKYADSLLTIIEPIQKTVYWVHGELARVAPKVEGVVFPWREKNTNEIDYASYKKITAILSDLAIYNDLIFDFDNHWNSLKQDTFSPDYTARLFSKLEDLKKIIVNFPKLTGTAFGKPENVSEVTKILAFTKSHDVKKLLDKKLIVSSLFNSANLKKEISCLEKIKQTLDSYDETAGIDKKFKLPLEWDNFTSNFSVLDKNIEVKKLINNKTNFTLIKSKLNVLEKTIGKNVYSSKICALNGETLKKYKNLFDTDPIVQKIKGWDERIILYEVQNNLKKIKDVFDQLVNAQSVLNEWAISVGDLEEKIVWEVEQRFATKYKTIFRIFSSKYNYDTTIITQWCVAHRPQNFTEYKKIIFAAADKLRLQRKFDKMMDEFVEKYAFDEDIRHVSLVSLIESITKILGYLEIANIDRLSSEIKSLVESPDSFDYFRQVISLYEELFEQEQLINTTINQELITDSITIDDFLKFTNQIIDEIFSVITTYEKTAKFINQDKLPTTLDALENDTGSLNNLKSLCNELIKLSFEAHTGKRNLNDLIGNQNIITEQQFQINSVLPILDNRSFTKDDFYTNLENLCSELEVWESWYLKYSQIKSELQILMNNEAALQSLEIIEMSSLSKYINKMITDVDGLERWIKFERLKSQLNDYGMGWFFNDICKYEIKQINFLDIFTWSFFNKLLSEIYETNETLKNFNMADYTRHIKEFRRLENEIFESNQYRVLSKVYPSMKYAMDIGGTSEKVLVRESQKIQRHLPIRKLVVENAAHLLNYKPCWMMSPLTLSSYIPFGAIKFDVVIFDEASQMKIENALGAISRAKQVIVIGDEHQLPPTSFFDLSSEDDEEEMEDVGYESILQSAITILPGAQSELLYHYRSTSDDLIAFSNFHIYNNRLITFPSPKYKNDAVKFEYVEDGVYDSGGTRRNRIEAIRVAELCAKHFESGPASLGVIAFSKAQEEAIREAVMEKIKEFPHLADKLDEVSDKKESFFIKNLESVQGDERDVIILSVGYGPDQNKVVYNRFGPLNSKGGYRRLNVAITRAKDKIICVSSMKFYQMSPPETSRGAVLLQKYLEYAEKGRETLLASKIAKQNDAEADSDFELSVQSALENIGYLVHRQIGASGFSIDLAIVNPENENEYILGIECDGAAYHSSKSARIRDRLRQEILERLGWKFYRIWSQHWITHRQAILDDIVKVINKR